MVPQDNKRDFLIFKHQTLKKELSDCKSIIAEATQSVFSLYYEKHKEDKQPSKKTEKESHISKQGPIPEQPAQEEVEPAGPQVDPQVKKMFRKIALKSHPDRLMGMSEHEVEEKKSLYQKAAAAFEEGDLATLSEIANKLKIDQPEFSALNFKELENKIKSLKKEIDIIQSTLIWKWYFVEDVKVKGKILEKLFEFINEKHNINNPGS